MKKSVLVVVLAAISLFTKSVAQEGSIFPKGEKAPNVHHAGNVWLNELSPADSAFTFNITLATFDAGARLDWHLHPGGQILLITEGTGYYQERGKSKLVVRKGDVIKCLPGIEHWHGASPENGVTYLAASPVQKGKTVWLKKLTDEEYNAQQKTPGASSKISTDSEREILTLSREKWRWMSEKKVDTLADLFHEKSMFVHMGGSWGKQRELEVIKSGGIWYKKAEVYSASVNFIGNTAILLNDIDLVAVVGGNEVVNPFMVTEVYVKENGKWMMGSLTFSRLMRPVKLNINTSNNNKQ